MSVPTIPSKVRYLVPVLCAAMILLWWIETPYGMTAKENAVGYAVCHQIPDHTFSLGDQSFPLCARCSGMYLGFVSGVVYQIFRYPRRGGFPSWKASLPFLFFALAWSVDGINSSLQSLHSTGPLYPPSNLLRLFTGTGMGLSISVILVPALHQAIWQRFDPRPVFSGYCSFRDIRPYLEMILIGFGVSVLILTSVAPTVPNKGSGALVFYTLAALSTAGVVLLLSTAYMLFWLLVFNRFNFAEKWRDLLIPFASGLLTAMLQIAGFDYLHFRITGTWGG